MLSSFAREILILESSSFNHLSLQVVHNYGHGGGGITLHWGCALDATRIVKELLTDSASTAKL